MATLTLTRDDGYDVLVDTKTRTVSFFGRSASFTLNEWKILKGLYFDLGMAVKREVLLRLIWNVDRQVESRVVDMHVASIRKKLKKLRLARIASVYGVGYRLVPTHEKPI